MGDNPYTTCYKGTIPWGIILRGGNLNKKYHFDRIAEITEWKCKNLSAAQILREINIRGSESCFSLNMKIFAI